MLDPNAQVNIARIGDRFETSFEHITIAEKRAFEIGGSATFSAVAFYLLIDQPGISKQDQAAIDQSQNSQPVQPIGTYPTSKSSQGQELGMVAGGSLLGALVLTGITYAARRLHHRLNENKISKSVENGLVRFGELLS